MVEALWQDGEQHTGEADEADADSANAAVQRFEQAIDAARKLCADSKEDLETALLQHQRALEIRTRVFGSGHPEVAFSCHNIANVYFNQGKRAQAMEMATIAYDIYLKVLGPDYLRTKQMLSLLSELGKQ